MLGPYAMKDIEWVTVLALTVPPALAVYGFATHPIYRFTLAWSVVYYYATGMGITMGYHRLWAHRTYNASVWLQYVLALAGAGAVQGSIKWWAHGHRSHHRYTDTDLDPYSAQKGLWWSHIGWLIIKPGPVGYADASDLTKNKVVLWQERHYNTLAIFMALVFPTLVAGLGWGDWKGGFFFAGAARLVVVHHSTFCVNSLAHWLGDAPFDDKHTPRDHFFTALVTFGEGYHNFHHQFPMDFRNAIKWYQYDPTKWLIWLMAKIGAASHLKTFSENEIKKGQYTMQLKKLLQLGTELEWPAEDLPIVTWEEFQAEAKKRILIAIHGFVHDCSAFLERHPGGAEIIRRAVGTDATAAFFGGVYDHSSAAHNLLAMMRVGVLMGGMEVEHLKTLIGSRTANASSTSLALTDEASNTTMVQAVKRRVASHASDLSAALETLRPANVPSSDRIVASIRASIQATVGNSSSPSADPFTLGIAPSQKLVIVQRPPSLRPAVAAALSSTL